MHLKSLILVDSIPLWFYNACKSNLSGVLPEAAGVCPRRTFKEKEKE